MVDILLGLQWGDEGKGKIVDYLAAQYDVIARFQGGPNAGHTLYVNGQKVVLRTIPSGVFHAGKVNLIGNGVVIDPITLKDEIEGLEKLGLPIYETLYLAEKAHLILPSHRALDAASEQAKGAAKIGSTLKGIGPAYMDRTGRNGLRVADVLSPNWEEKYNQLKQKHMAMLKTYAYEADWKTFENGFDEAIAFLRKLKIVNGEYWINEQLEQGKKILAEGAQGSMLDVDYGTYPFVTSSNTISAGVCTGLGVAPQKIGKVYGISKAYCTRVGGGPFPTELHDELGEKLREAGSEFGAVTKRPRRCGWMDLVALKYTIMLSGVTSLVLTKSDVLDEFDEIKAAVAYEVNGEETAHLPYDLCTNTVLPVYRTFKGWKPAVGTCNKNTDLPGAFKDYIQFLETYLNVKVEFVSTGVGRDQLLQL